MRCAPRPERGAAVWSRTALASTASPSQPERAFRILVSLPGLVHFGMDSRAGGPAAKPTAALIGGIIYVISSAYAHAQSA